MSRIFTCLLLVLSISVQAQNPKKYDDYRVKIKIPSSWVEKVKKYDYKQNNSELLQEFDSYIKPLSLDTGESHKWGNLEVSKSKGGLLNPLFVDVDAEYGAELICLLGWDDDRPSIGVFKKIEATWYLLYLESFYMWYDAPDLYVANNVSKNKTFYIRRVYDHGSGIYSDGYAFYKLINNKVYHCLELVNDAHIDIWGMPVNQETKLNLRFAGSADAVRGYYDYSFSLGGADDCGADSFCPPLPILSGRGQFSYEWNNTQHSYKLVTPPGIPPGVYLNEKKIACFGAFGADSLFASAFRDEINNVLKTGTPRQKKLLTRFVPKAKK